MAANCSVVAVLSRAEKAEELSSAGVTVVSVVLLSVVLALGGLVVVMS